MYQATFISNTLKVRPLTEDEEVLAPTLKDSVYDFCADGNCGYYAIRETEDEAVHALLDYLESRIKELSDVLSEFKSARKIIRESFRTPKCWNCKYWGSVRWYYKQGQDTPRPEGHAMAVGYGQATACCPFRLKPNGNPRCMPRYHEVCEHFEECVNNE